MVVTSEAVFRNTLNRIFLPHFLAVSNRLVDYQLNRQGTVQVSLKSIKNVGTFAFAVRKMPRAHITKSRRLFL